MAQVVVAGGSGFPRHDMVEHVQLRAQGFGGLAVRSRGQQGCVSLPEIGDRHPARVSHLIDISNPRHGRDLFHDGIIVVRKLLLDCLEDLVPLALNLFAHLSRGQRLRIGRARHCLVEIFTASKAERPGHCLDRDKGQGGYCRHA
ncbi:hypothetical protein [Mesorhizobium huakuii]|uniref:hypothetical protein n=1 Tax=Mesorhizobium huakuii TaxID=28104 RepID=UPI0024E0AF77|nr:hypothetical protein [Mesorhizobium huakuii]